MKTKLKGFTLAEVLITLTIIGVIATLTIPNLMQKYQDYQTVVAVKEAYSLFENALKLAIKEYGPLTEWDWPENTANGTGSSENSKFIMNRISQYLKVTKNCIGIEGCQPKIYAYKNLHDTNSDYLTYTGKGGISLANGMIFNYVVVVYRWGHASWNNQVGMILVDVNGKKEPNRFGYDMFAFDINDNGICRNKCSHSSEASCNINKTTSSQNGYGCSNWILKHGNMDYKYRDVSAEW